MSAKFFVWKWGQQAIGKNILTQPYGAYPGGIAEVVNIHPDPEAPEIVMTVKHPTWTNEEGESEIGVFDHEEVFPESTIL